MASGAANNPWLHIGAPPTAESSGNSTSTQTPEVFFEPISYADLDSTVGVLNQAYQIVGGDDEGVRLVWQGTTDRPTPSWRRWDYPRIDYAVGVTDDVDYVADAVLAAEAAASAADLSASQAAASAAEAALVSPSGSFSEMLAVATPIQGEAFLVTSGMGNRSNWWFYDGIRAQWYPLENRLLVASAVGTKTTPLASVLGSAGAGAQLASVTIPAGALRAGCELRVWATITREGSTDLSLIQVRLGTNNSAVDNAGGNVSFTAQNPAGGQAIRPLVQFFVQSQTAFLAGGGFSVGGSSGSSTITEFSSQFDTEDEMFVTFYTGGTVNAADVFKLLAYSIEVFYGV